jgi:sigma-B regulation protein RsbU (phosphoserine phosphatase)
MRLAKTIAARLILATVFSTALVFALVLGIVDYRSQAIVEAEAAQSARHLAQASVYRVEAVLGAVAKTAESLARTLESGEIGDQELRTLLRRSVESNPEIFGAAAAFEPDALGGADRRYAPYYFRDGGKISSLQLGETENYPLQDWYQIPRELGRAEWSEPYYDEGGGKTLMASLSVPFHSGSGEQRRIKGIVTADIALNWLTKTIGEIKVLDTGYAFLLSRNGTVITHPDAARMLNETIFSVAEARDDPAMRELGRRMIRGETGFAPYLTYKDVKSRLYYAPIPSTGWTLAIVFPEAELFDDVRTLTLTVTAMGIAGLLLLAGITLRIARSLTRPLGALATATAAISEGRFDVPLPAATTQDEVGALSRAFKAMTIALREHIRRLVETTAVKERIEGELRIAHDIQMSILPKMLPPFPQREEFDLHAAMVTAKEVGGDFYDFFEIDDNHLCLVIADVAGKGVPASLFMAVTKTLIKATAKVGRSAAEILGAVNDEIASDNEQSMFVTVFCGVLDLTTGELVYTNAGHNPPMLLRRGAAPAWLPAAPQLVVGAMPGTCYCSSSIVLERGDRLLLYTDGVTEAVDLDGSFYGEQRLLRDVAQISGTVRDGVAAIITAVETFAAGTEPADDITVLLIEFRGPG